MTSAKQTILALRRLSLRRLTFSKLFTDLCESRSVMCLSSPSVNYCCCLRRPLISLGLPSSFVLVRLLYYVLLHYIWDAERRIKRTHYNKQLASQETNAVEWKARLCFSDCESCETKMSTSLRQWAYAATGQQYRWMWGMKKAPTFTKPFGKHLK